jgi:hypothetical protein
VKFVVYAVAVSTSFSPASISAVQHVRALVWPPVQAAVTFTKAGGGIDPSARAVYGGCTLSEIAGSNTSGGMDLSLSLVNP